MLEPKSLWTKSFQVWRFYFDALFCVHCVLCILFICCQWKNAIHLMDRTFSGLLLLQQQSSLMESSILFSTFERFHRLYISIITYQLLFSLISVKCIWLLSSGNEIVYSCYTIISSFNQCIHRSICFYYMNFQKWIIPCYFRLKMEW